MIFSKSRQGRQTRTSFVPAGTQSEPLIVAALPTAEAVGYCLSSLWDSIIGGISNRPLKLWAILVPSLLHSSEPAVGRNRIAVRRRGRGVWIGRPKVALAPLGNLGLEDGRPLPSSF